MIGTMTSDKQERTLLVADGAAICDENGNELVGITFGGALDVKCTLTVIESLSCSISVIE